MVEWGELALGPLGHTCFIYPLRATPHGAPVLFVSFRHRCFQMLGWFLGKLLVYVKNASTATERVLKGLRFQGCAP